MGEINSKELALEEYKHEISVYKNYREKLNSLQKIAESLRPYFLFCFGVCFFVILLVSILSNVGLWSSIAISGFLSLYIALFSSESDFLASIFSFGKFNKIKEQIKEVQELERNSYSKLQPFEKTIRDYCETHLKEFFEKNLYRKRSGNQSFEESLSEFASMVEEVSIVNLITTRIPLAEYEDYLMRRTIDHSFQTSKKTERLAPIRTFIKNFSRSQEQKPIFAPEKLYRTARRIDNWEEINKKRKMTGLKGEEIAVAIEQEFFESIDRKDLAEKVRHVSAEDGDGLGYDVLSFFENGKEKYIEVKSTTASLGSSFYLSRNELEFLKEHNEDAFIYRVLISGEVPQVIAYSSPEVLEKNEIIPVQYMVKTK